MDAHTATCSIACPSCVRASCSQAPLFPIGVYDLQISPLPAALDSTLRKVGWAIEISWRARSETERPRSSAIPYSVTTVSASLRAVVTIPPLKLGTMRETALCARSPP